MHQEKAELHIGVMTGGKTTHLITSYQQCDGNKKAFKPKKDNRFDEEKITTHSGLSIPAKPVEKAKEILDVVIKEKLDVIAIDEVQFFSERNQEGIYEVVDLVNTLRQMDKKVILAGLDRDFRGEIFGPMKEVMEAADVVSEHVSTCVQCKEDATMTQRLVNGEPAYYDDPVVLVGSTKENAFQEKYEPRCVRCHVVKTGKRK